MAVQCKGCGQTWPRDPALEVVCPTCNASVGVKCRRPSEHRCDIHHERDRLAMEMGFLEQCPAGATAVAQQNNPQLSLFDVKRYASG